MSETFEYLSHLMTLAPYGGAGTATIWLALITLSLLLLVFAVFLKESRKPLLVTSTLAFLYTAASVYSTFDFESKLDLNPSFSISDLVGTWKNDASVIILHPDQAASFDLSRALSKKLGILGSEGMWMKSGDFFVVIGGEDADGEFIESELRVIMYNHEYRLIQDVEDFDTWNGHLGYRKQ